LADGEFVEGEVVVEGADDPVAVGPDGAFAVLFVALGVGVAGEVEPDFGPAFAELGVGEEGVDVLGVVAGADEFGGEGGRGGDAEEVEGEPSEDAVELAAAEGEARDA